MSDMTLKELAAFDEAVARIAQAEREGWTELDLSRMGLTELPSEIGRLTALRILNVSGNKLTAVPDALSQLSQLQSLDLGSNRLTAIPDTFGQLTQLQKLDLSNNQLMAIPYTLGQMGQLQELLLYDNQLAVLPNTLGKLTQLKFLDLGGNRLIAIPETLGQLFQLQMLDLGSNQLTAIPNSLGQLAQLQIFSLEGNMLAVTPNTLVHLVRLQELHLSGNQLTTIPHWLYELTQLRKLNLGRNQIATVPDMLGQLLELRELNLSRNQLMAVPNTFGQLTQLQTLDLNGNQLQVVPNALGQLTQLQTLFLSNNQLTTVSDTLDQLTQLQELRLNDNQLETVPNWLRDLTKLRRLDLDGNRLTEVPDWLAKMPELKALFIASNPIVQPPPEQLGEALTKPWKPVDIDALRRYFTELQQGGEAYFYEAKLLVIGDGGTGKSSLVRKMQDTAALLPPPEDSTDGIDIQTWSFPLDQSLLGYANLTGLPTHYKVNIWDFGGQTIYRATHQFFFTKRSVYVLVTDTRRQLTDFYDWLRMQEVFGADSPIILLKNRNRQHGNECVIENLPHLQTRFPNLKEIVEIDLSNVPHEADWPEFLRYLKKHFIALDHVGESKPKTWLEVRRRLDVDPRETISKSEYLALCAQCGISDPVVAIDLSGYLHHMGGILHFNEDPILTDLVILKPTWGLDAVYRILDNKDIIAAKGKFTLAQLHELWHEDRYNNYRYELRRLMENFRLCYPLRDVPDTYIAPQLLGNEIPTDYKWTSGKDDLQLRYKYHLFMPRGLISRAIVELHRRIEDQRLVWRTGVILRDKSARAELLEMRDEGEIRIRVGGKNKRDMLMEIVRALDDLHRDRDFVKFSYEKLVPCNCTKCQQLTNPYFFSLDMLYGYLAHKIYKIRCGKPPFIEVQVRSLIDDTISQTDIPSERGITVQIIEGDNIMTGDKNTGDTFNMSGDFRGANVNIKSRLENVQQTIGALPHADEAAKAELQQLIAQLNDALQEAPEDKAEEAEAVAQMVETLVETANSEKPNKMMLEITGDGLKKAAENVAAVMPTVLVIATQIVTAVANLVR